MIDEEQFEFILKTLTRQGFWIDNDSDGLYNPDEQVVSFYLPETGGRITIDWPDDLGD